MAPTIPWSPLSGPTRSVALEVLIHGPLSRSELARRLDLSAGSLTRLTKPLLESGLLVESGPAKQTGIGRPTQPLDIVADSHHFVGVKLTGDQAHGVLTTLRSEVITSDVRPLRSKDPADVIDVVTAIVEALSTQHPVTALGVSLAGIVDSDGVVHNAAYLDWDGVPLRSLLEDRLGLPTAVENDLAAWTEAEHWFGAGRGEESFALLTIGVGIGYGLVTNGHRVASVDSGVGVLGHVPLDPLGPMCSNGHKGCSTAMLSTAAICSAASVALGRTIAYDECLRLAQEGNPAARAIVDASGHALGRLIAMIANFTMVTKIIISGDGVALADVAEAAVEEGIAQDRSPYASALRVIRDHSGFIDWARGAAAIAIQTYVLNPPHPRPVRAGEPVAAAK